MPTDEQIEAAAMAVAGLEQCGGDIDGKRTLCDNPKLGDQIIDPCYCRVIALAALSAAEAQEVKPRVKSLVWEKLSENHYRAAAPFFGNFRVERYSKDWQANWSVPGYCASFVEGDFPTMEAAKAAVEARILGALE